MLLELLGQLCFRYCVGQGQCACLRLCFFLIVVIRFTSGFPFSAEVSFRSKGLVLFTIVAFRILRDYVCMSTQKGARGSRSAWAELKRKAPFEFIRPLVELYKLLGYFTTMLAALPRFGPVSPGACYSIVWMRS